MEKTENYCQQVLKSNWDKMLTQRRKLKKLSTREKNQVEAQNREVSQIIKIKLYNGIKFTSDVKNNISTLTLHLRSVKGTEREKPE